MTVFSSSLQETYNIGAKIAAALKPGAILALSGDPGSGKTELVRGIISAMASSDTVRSPSFSLVNTYSTNAGILVYHYDFYRLKTANELFETGFDEYIFDTDSITIIEWASMFPSVLPKERVYSISFSTLGENDRKIEMDDTLFLI